MSEQKTEQPTPRRLEKARQEGQFVVSRDLVGAVQFFAFVALLGIWGEEWLAHARHITRVLLQRAFGPDLSTAELQHFGFEVLTGVFLPIGLGGGLLVVLTLAIQLVTTRMGFSLKKLSPNLARLNPASRLRELPRQNGPALVKAIIMLPAFLCAVYVVARDSLGTYFVLPLEPVETAARQAAASMQTLLWKAVGVFLVFGVLDLFRQRRQYVKDLRMTKQEIREEAKEIEGNPQIKARIRRLQRDLVRRQMMKQVTTATAVIVNPTHYAVALRYQHESMGAPLVVAKGKNYLALRIRQRAVEHEIPIIENPPLAQSLYKSADVGQEIPVHLYRAVAEILAYIYRLTNRRF